MSSGFLITCVQSLQGNYRTSRTETKLKLISLTPSLFFTTTYGPHSFWYVLAEYTTLSQHLQNIKFSIFQARDPEIWSLSKVDLHEQAIFASACIIIVYSV